jgi:predicted nucleic acid-binding Zn ribbon protein
MNIYTDYVFPDKLISPVNGYTCKKITKQNIKKFGFSSKEELVENYPEFPLLSECAKDQIKNASLKGSQIISDNAAIRNKDAEKNYYITPKNCLFCQTSIPFKERDKKFCNSSCAASHNNKKKTRKPWNEEQRKAQSEKIKSTASWRSHTPRTTPYSKNYCSVSFSKCKICDKGITHRGSKPSKLTCSRDCQIIASTGLKTYQNGRKKLFKYFNIHQNKIITLESSFELKLAKFLDERGIVWIRPKPIKWVDPRDGKNRFYYPDFYLSDYGIYLDPKNSYVIKLDQTKLSVVSKMIWLIYGHVDAIIEEVSKIEGGRGS